MEYTATQTMNTARQRADVENSPHFSEAELIVMLNSSLSVLHSKKVLLGEDQFTRERVMYTAAGVEDYSIGGDFYKLCSVDIQTESERWRAAERWTWAERHIYLDNVTWSPGRPVAYRLVGSRIRFLPTPEASYKIAIFYVQAAQEVELAADTVDYGPGEHEWVVMDMASKMLAKEESDPSLQIAERERLWAEVISPSVASRDMNRADRVQDVELMSGNMFNGRWTR